MEKLYTSEEIAEIYGVSSYTVTNNWGKKGLKRIRGAGNSYLYKKEWVEEYLENQATSNKSEVEVISISRPNINKCKRKNVQFVV